MSNRLFVGGLAWATTEDALKTLFSQAGTVVSATVIVDRDTGRSKGFGFVEMSSKDEAQSAIAGLNGKDIKGQSINVNEARPRTENRRNDGTRGAGRSGGSGGRGRGNGGGRRF